MTPLALAAMLPPGSGRMVLLSGRNDDELGQWSFVSALPTAIFVLRGRSFEIINAVGACVARGDCDPCDAIAAFVADHQWPSADDGPLPSVVGYLSYEMGAALEHVATQPQALPDVVLAAYAAVWRWSPAATTPQLMARDAAAAARLRQLEASNASDDRLDLRPPPLLGELAPDDDAAVHRARIAAVQAYIAAGDVYQVNVARRWSAPVLAPGDPLTLLARIHERAPAPYSALFEFAEGAVVSASPELFLQQRNHKLETRPIKGTRRRNGIAVEDAAARADLLVAEKDSAEHLMIVDLERNDIGRICDVGSVHVDGLGYVVELPHLYHRVSRVRGTLRTDVGLADVLRATFPGGSITGAPKVRAMQIIAELEPFARGPYCGAIGWFGHCDAAPALELAMGIRCAVITPETLHVYVGGGIVADSSPQAEVDETDDKLAGWRLTLGSLR